MGAIAAVGGGAFVLACLILGSRLFLLGWRRRALPELCIGAGLFLMGGLGYPLMLVARHLSPGPALQALLLVAYLCCNIGGNAGVCLFNWKVFRPRAGWAAGVAMAVPGALFGLAIAQLTQSGVAGFFTDAGGPWQGASHVAMAVYLWSGSESLAYFLRMRRRQRVGLADPVVTDRFRLWAVGTLTAVAISAVGITCQALGVEFRASMLGALTIGGLGLVTAASMWLAFLPPPAYLRWVRSRAEAAAVPVPA